MHLTRKLLYTSQKFLRRQGSQALQSSTAQPLLTARSHLSLAGIMFLAFCHQASLEVAQGQTHVLLMRRAMNRDQLAKFTKGAPPLQGLDHALRAGYA